MILVCYLLAAGDEFAERGRAFAQSYRDHWAGVTHELLLILKDHAEVPDWHDPHWPIIVHDNEGLDIGSLQRVAGEHPAADRIMWLGAHCRILGDDWLAKFLRASEIEGVGAVSATGSFEAGVSGERPNAHLRTSTLMINPLLLNTLGFAAARDRRDCYEFEHGQHSLYRRLRTRGLHGLVVGRSGRVYPAEHWGASDTFRHGDQRELLIADNHTDHFAAAGPEEREALARAAGWEP